MRKCELCGSEMREVCDVESGRCQWVCKKCGRVEWVDDDVEH